MKNNYQLQLEEFLEIVGKNNASDLHLSVGKKPAIRVDGELIELVKYPILSGEHATGLIYALLTEEQKQKLFTDKEIDLSYNYKEKARYRVNVFFQRGYISAALRFLPSKIRTVKELNLPQIVEKFASHSQGFLLIVGPTGHGKTTTMAALIDYINHHFAKHIVTIEDPIEYVFDQDKSLIEQREVGNDTKSFARALRGALRQDPDVIMVGEMRDLETISTALTAAETGHLVIATLHTNNAAQTIDRVIDSFPAEAKNQVRAQLAATLLGVVSQRLIPRVNGGRIPAVEVMLVNSAVRNLIRDGKIYQIDLVIETSSDEGMISLNRSLADLVHKGAISLENAEIYSLNPSDLRMLLGK
ncbi:MAG: type IV pili twitching motility protein PilT [Candidatus Portnoybacteria bacterium RBG_13_40_8]|uniref:Type IV pili twitching motility protein PilT n=1 Tax=Candidatus Portnoybacteria bacterium RBG_13_40_8 TaxID=1801990 RepID=A0A1G2F5W4_9BACT|nr:MAG: type IV pili twitching motility protein PilT [Candidatus Portnoybacteria bacterium RBG_13_40_8]OGZ35540.1 MAG: type IV pili twitching motility protein PilT [Candidatus Portnoybacteria bacterium RIFCSPHIGHO2_01_FULL_39_19]